MEVYEYARVSLKMQDTDDKVSIDQQLADMDALCERNDWRVIGVFIDRENYRATQQPNKGKIVNPSGERADRLEFLVLLEHLKTGEADAVLCWRDDRLVRHPRVAVALEDALDQGDAVRASKGRSKIQIYDATGAIIDRFTLSIKATIWREENKRRVERSRMGKVATLQQGLWPGAYKRLGYRTRKGVRGRIIEIEEDEARVVRTICEMYDAGINVKDIRRYLINNGFEQKPGQVCVHQWCTSSIYRILQAEGYTGVATWHFNDGTSMSIPIPAVIDRALWERNQERLKRNKIRSTRNAKDVYLLQGILYCGDCGGDRRMSVRNQRFLYRNGTRKKRKSGSYHLYYCYLRDYYPEEAHPAPCRSGPLLDWQVWRQLVDNGIKRPDLIRDQVQARQEKLRTQGEGVDSEIAHARLKMVELAQERAFYQRQAARGKMTEIEFDQRMAETEETNQYWQTELKRLQELRDDAAKVQAGLDYATELFTKLQDVLPGLEQTPDELKALPADERRRVLETRQSIIRALCDKVIVYADGRVVIEGVLDGSEAAQFELTTPAVARA